MTSRSRKVKGKKLQNFVRDRLIATFTELEQGDIESRPASNNGEDIILSPHARRLLPVSIEVKNQENIRIHKAIEQAKSNAGKYEPVVVFSRNRTEPSVVIRLEYFLELLRKVNG